MKRVLLTGADGFAGRHLVTELNANGYEVHGLLRLQPEDPTRLPPCARFPVADLGDTAALASAVTAKYYYITKNIVDPVTGANKEAFTIDTDTFLLDEKVLRLGVIWQWKSNKGLPYAEDLASYETALAEAVSRDKGSKVITVGAQRLPGGFGAEHAYPHTVG